MVQPFANRVDRWYSILDDDSIFLVKALKTDINHLSLYSHGVAAATTWRKVVPRKVCEFLWRLLKGRIRVCAALDNIVGTEMVLAFGNGDDAGWYWILDDDGIFLVKALKTEIEHLSLSSHCVAAATTWSKVVPKKAFVFLWRLLKGRIPTTYYLVRCNFVSSIWSKVFNWFNVGNFNGLSIDKLLAHEGTPSFSSRKKLLLNSIIWISRSLIIWKCQNKVVFKDQDEYLDAFTEIHTGHLFLLALALNQAF
ncbi:hypothetical protein CTI12_AA541360 [Artemisia annua]|uniref:Reverse transcriptase zinc-binding domain-containing protein n=1 Tax=Artemisia annua TaxID=35608 RepID=A0A2U1L180_ARTAN|nr:hypothetical protein CTI12_AA541360 [Artemisia annua]